jgi:hypothetical protein
MLCPVLTVIASPLQIASPTALVYAKFKFGASGGRFAMTDGAGEAILECMVMKETEN